MRHISPLKSSQRLSGFMLTSFGLIIDLRDHSECAVPEAASASRVGSDDGRRGHERTALCASQSSGAASTSMTAT